MASAWDIISTLLGIIKSARFLLPLNLVGEDLLIREIFVASRPIGEQYDTCRLAGK